MNRLCTLFGSSEEAEISTSRLSRSREQELNCELVSLANLKGMLVGTTPKLKLRFIVDTDGMLWFALEGIPSSRIPAHFQMTGSPFLQAKCLAAGNFSFIKEKENEPYTLTIINKSGDFKPNLECLKWPIAILAVNLEKSPDLLNIKDDIVIEKSPPEPTKVLTVQIKSADTMAWVNQVFSPQKIDAFQNQTVQNKVISYSGPVQDSEAPIRAAKRSILMLPEFKLDTQALGANSESTNQNLEDLTTTLKRQKKGFSMFNSAANGACLALEDKENTELDEITSPFRS